MYRLKPGKLKAGDLQLNNIPNFWYARLRQHAAVVYCLKPGKLKARDLQLDKRR